MPRLLSIAGSDSGGGAGIQADLKAFARCGVHGMTAVTAVTAQNTDPLAAVYPLPPEAIVEQVRAVVEDTGVDAVKIGMLGTSETIEAVGRALDLVPDAPVVLDPVMVAESGARLLDERAEESLIARLLPRAAMVTPNLAEAAVLAGAGREVEPGSLARSVHALGPAAVVVTGGHRSSATDVFFNQGAPRRDPGRASRGWGRSRIGLHPLVRPGRPPSARLEPVGRGPLGEGDRLRGDRPRSRGVGAGAGPVDALGALRAAARAAASEAPRGPDV